MEHPVKYAWSIMMLAVLLALPAAVLGQGRFTVNGRLKIEGGDMTQTRVVVFKDGVKERSLASGLSKFTMDLELGHNYIMEFEKEGFVTKKLSFNTHVPAEASEQGFTQFDFSVSLFKQYDDLNIVVFNQPVGLIRFDEMAGDFDYDTDYTRSIQTQLQQVLAQVEEKQKEEAEAAKGMEAKAEQEARQKAKAEAEAAKARAKVEAEAAKAAQARTAEEEKARAEAVKQAAAREKETVAKQPAAPRTADKATTVAGRAEKEEARSEARVPERSKPAPIPAVLREKPAPPAPRGNPAQPALVGRAIVGQDRRRTIGPTVMEEASRMARARMNDNDETRPAEMTEEPTAVYDRQTSVEPTRVTTVVTVSLGDDRTEYRKITHKFGAIYHFKDGLPCTEHVYEQGTQGEQLAGAMPRFGVD